MITDYDKRVILECAQKYKVSEVILFGSSLQKTDTNDIDIGIKGVRPELFFKFFGELLLRLSKSVDVIVLDKRNFFTEIVEKEGIKLYG